MLKTIRLLILCSLFSTQLNAEAENPSEESRNHSYSLGVLFSRFFADLKDLQGPGMGVVGAYRYRLGDFAPFYGDIGSELAFHQNKKDDFLNRHILVAVQQRILWASTNWFANGLILGLQVDYWTNALKDYKSNLLHDDSLYGLQLGYAFIFHFTDAWSSDLAFKYHFQEFDKKSTYLSTTFEIVWRP